MGVRFALVVIAALSCAVERAGAETIWERALRTGTDDDVLTHAAIERVAMGMGDERDLLRVRVALITLSRGEVSNPRSLVHLLRLRREMGLVQAALAPRLLADALRADLSSSERAWAHVEFAHLLLRERDTEGARQHLEQSLAFAWRSQVRAEVLVLLGYSYLRDGRSDEALAALSSLERFPAPRRLRVQAGVGRALAYALRGDAVRVSLAAREAFGEEARRASVSRLDPFWDLAFTPEESRAARALLLWGRAEMPQPRNEAAGRGARLAACLLVRGTALQQGSERSAQAEAPPAAPPWGQESLRILHSLWETACTAARLAEEQEEAAEGQAAEER